MTEQMISVRLVFDEASKQRVFIDTQMPVVEVGVRVTLPFNKVETPNDKTRIFLVYDLNWRADLEPHLLEADIMLVEDENLTIEDFLASGWKIEAI